MRSLVPITLSFPMAGVSRRSNYRHQERPYASPYAVNVRGVGVLEGRSRGGSRPGLKDVGTVGTQSEEAWQWPNGEPLEWVKDSSVTFSMSEDALTAPDGTLIVNPAALIKVSAKKGAAPSGYGVCCVYRDRVFVAKDSMWYASRMGDHGDFDYGADFEDVAKAVAGNVSTAGKPGEYITALIPFRDSILFIATAKSLYALKGDPADGRVETVSEEVGIVAPYSWARADETVAFLSNDGVYVMSAGSRPQRFSENRMPDELRSVDVDTNTVLMAYDPVGMGFHLFITPDDADENGSHYWLELENKAVWPVAFANGGHQPVAVGRMKQSGIEEVIVLGRDGGWRTFDVDSDDDDGTDITSTVVLGVVMIAPNDVDDAVLAELSGVLAAGSNAVTWGLSSGASAEQAADRAVAGYFDATGTWSALRNPVDRPRIRGPWVAVTITSTNAWAYEAVVLKSRQLGRLRI